MIGIIGAMIEEIEVIKSLVTNLKEENRSIRTFYTGKISNKEVVIVLAGIGKVNAGITTSLLIENYDVKQIINIGVAGGQNGVKHKDVVISTEVLFHDVNVTNFGKYLHGQVPGMPPTFKADINLLRKTEMILKNLHFNYKIGRIATGDQFVYQGSTLNEINKVYNDIYAVEMEASAIGQTAHMYNVPFIVYRSISDVIDDEKQSEDFNKFLAEAANNAALVLVELIEVL